MSVNTARTLLLVAMIFFIIQIITGIIGGVWFYFFWPQLIASLASLAPPEVMSILTALFAGLQNVVLIGTAITAIISIIFLTLVVRWRPDPVPHRRNLIIIGILGIFFAGLIPGILTLVAGLIIEKEEPVQYN